jgi:hypothetical protein
VKSTLSLAAFDFVNFTTAVAHTLFREVFGNLPDESTILRFRHRLEKQKLAEQIFSPFPFV